MESLSLFFHITFLAAAVSGTFQVQSPDARQVAEVGSDTFLHCTLSPPLQPIGLQVHWFRSSYLTTVFLQNNGKEEKDMQSPEYRGRASLRAGTDAGDLTLILHNVSLSDADTYHCLVQNISSELYEEGVTELSVIGTGTLPVLEVSLEDNAVLVSFITSDWFPRPEMRWKVDGAAVITDNSEIVNQQSNGLFQLESRILLKDPNDGHLYGAVRHPVTGKEVGLYMKLAADMFPRLSSWAYAFIFVSALMIAGAVLAIVYFKRQLTQKETLHEEIGVLSSEVDWRRAAMSPEYITFSPETAYPDLSVADDFLTLMNQPPSVEASPCASRFETERCCLGLPAFSSGCHYWEVELGNGLEWAVGVASPQVQRRGAYMFRPEMHIWCISRFMENLRALDTQESTLVVAGGTLQRVGVYLNLSGPREITFYDPGSWDLLYTFHDVAEERGSVLPFFWLGRNGGEVKLRSRAGR